MFVEVSVSSTLKGIFIYINTQSAQSINHLLPQYPRRFLQVCPSLFSSNCLAKEKRLEILRHLLTLGFQRVYLNQF